MQDISKSFDQGEGIPVDTLLIVYLLFADDLVLFSDSANGLQVQGFLSAHVWALCGMNDETHDKYTSNYSRIHK